MWKPILFLVVIQTQLSNVYLADEVKLDQNCSKEDACADLNATYADGYNGFKCTCKPEYFKKNGTCTDKIKRNQNCSEGDVCADLKATCTCGFKCTCTPEYFNKTGTCTEEIKLNQNCSDGDVCADLNATCTDGLKCTCTPEYFNKNGTCTDKIKRNQNCSEGDVCADLNATCTCGFKFTCTPEYFNKTGTCTEEITLNQNCSEGDVCADLNATCTDGFKCTCKPEYFNKNGTCTEMCLKPNATCTDGSKCACKADYFFENGTCALKIKLNQNCSEGDVCADLNAACTDGFKCTCKPEYFNKNETCTDKIKLNQNCSEGDVCADLNAACPDGFKCTCKPEYFNKNGTCTEKIKLNQNCAEGDVCLNPNATCTDGSKCACKADYFFENGTCALKIKLNQNCSEGDVCADLNATCTDGFKCTCKPEYFNKNGTCTEKIKLNQNCAEGDVCLNPNATCTDGSKCACKADYFFENGTCALRPLNAYVKKASSNTDSITFDLNIYPDDSRVNGFSVKYKLKGDHLEKFEVFEGEISTIRIGNLIAGNCYIFQIYSMIDDNKSVNATTLHNCTRPSSNVTVEVTQKEEHCLVINLWKVAGHVDKYEIRVNGTVQYFYCKHNPEKIIIDGLQPGNIYAIEIVTIANNLNSTRPVSLNISTLPSSNLTIQNRSSTNSTISFELGKGPGIVQSYIVRINGTSISFAYTNPDQSIVIEQQKSGYMIPIEVLAESNMLHSKNSVSFNITTYPPTADIKITGHSSEQVNMTITNRGGNVENYIIILENANTSETCKYINRKETFQYKPDQRDFYVDQLTPGTMYRLSVISMTYGLNSTSDTYSVITDPYLPKFWYKKLSIHSLVITIQRGKGCVDHYNIYLDNQVTKCVTSQFNDSIDVEINGLEDHKNFRISVSAFSYGVEVTQPEPLIVKTDLDSSAAIGGSLGGVAALLIILGFVYSWRKQIICFRPKKPTDVLDARTNDWFEENDVEMSDTKRQRPVKLKDFSAIITKMSRNSNIGFSRDYKELGLLSPKHSSEVCQTPGNRPKNRYTNILPFDHSLVKLIAVQDQPGSDFINANYIEGYSCPREYIAAQGPLHSTLADFWRMIWEQNVGIVVMLTQLFESGKKKCEIYWPEVMGEKGLFGDIIVEVETQSFLPEYALRTVVLRLGDIEKKVQHYNFLAWPDMDTPKSTNSMINFVDTVRNDVKLCGNGPVVVHCSAGVGRTGTFIAIDILLQQLRSGCEEVDIFGTILKMRENRVNLVQTEDQYVFIFKCIRDFIEASDDKEDNLYENRASNQIYANVP